jgi:hypothetical protein
MPTTSLVCLTSSCDLYGKLLTSWGAVGSMMKRKIVYLPNDSTTLHEIGAFLSH